MRRSLHSAIKKVVSVSILSLLLFAVSTSPAACVDLDGRWIGRGTFKVSPSAPNRVGRCNIRFTGEGHGAAVQMTGHCRAFVTITRVRGAFARTGRKGQVAAHLSYATYGLSLDYVGTESRASITLNSTNKVLTESRQYRSEVRLTFRGSNVFTMTEHLVESTTGRRVEVLNLVFRRR